MGDKSVEVSSFFSGSNRKRSSASSGVNDPIGEKGFLIGKADLPVSKLFLTIGEFCCNGGSSAMNGFLAEEIFELRTIEQVVRTIEVEKAILSLLNRASLVGSPLCDRKMILF